MTTSRLAPILALAVLLAACSGSVEDLPSGALVTCTTTADCPGGTICQPVLGRCIAAGADDRTPPGLVPGSASVTPAAARAGTPITVTFEADEDLAFAPEIRFVGAANTLGVPHRDGRVYTVQYPASVDDGAGTHAVVARLVDLAGNVAATVPIGEVVLDFTPPSASDPVVTPAFVRSGAVLQATITFSEPLDAAGPTLQVAGGPALAAAPGGSANSWVFTRTLTGAEPQGSIDLLLTAHDPAGNELSQRFAGVTTFDFVAPTVEVTDVRTPALRAGDTFGAQVRFAEPLSAPPTVVLAPVAGGPSVPVTASAIDGRTYALSLDVPFGTADGAQRLQLVAAADRAGNPATPVSLATVTLDSTPPAVLGLAPSHASGLYRAGQPVAVSFTTSEDLAGTPAVRLDLNPIPLDLPCLSTGTRAWTCTSALALSGSERPESVVNVSVTAADAAGNVTVAATPVVLDFTAPRVLSAAPGQAAFPAGSTVSYTVGVSEPLAAAPALTVKLGGTAVPGFFGAPSSQTATTYTWSRAVPAGADGAYTVDVALQDQAGNAAGPLAGTGFLVDTVAPAISGAITVSPAKAAFKAGDQLAVTFTVSEDVPTPTARLTTATPIAAPCVAGGPRTFTCTVSRALTAADLPEGAVAVLISLADAAGNVGVGSKPVTLDYTPPTVSGSAATQLIPGAGNLRSSVAVLGPGTTLKVSILASEPLAAAPSVWLQSPTGTILALSNVGAVGTSYAYQLTLDATARLPATWGLYWDPVDLAGNGWPAGGKPQLGSIPVDADAPPAPATGTAAAPALTWTRTPWGSQATAGAPLFQLTGTAASTGGGADLVVAWDGSGAGAREVGRAAVGGAGFTMPLGSDPNDLWLSAVDPAGNVSPRTRVVDVAWTAGLTGKVPGSTFENPHRLATRAFSTLALTQADDVEVAGSALGLQGDGLTVTTGAAALFRSAAGLATPGPRNSFSLAYDAGRGKVVLFGGRLYPGPSAPGDTWEWDGSSWRQVVPLDPEGDGNPPADFSAHPMAYDPALGGVVLATNNLWLWNGTSWKALDLGMFPAPGYRDGGAMAWDATRGVMVLYGGAYSNETWEFDGVAWRNATPALATDSPAGTGRDGSALVYDTIRRKVLLFGGMTVGGTFFHDLYTWDGTRWAALAAAGTAPPGRVAMAAAWDATNQELVFQGGVSAIGPVTDGKTFVLRTVAGTPTWLDKTPIGFSPGMSSHAAIWNQGARVVQLVGDETSGQLRSWSGSLVGSPSWSLAAPGDPEGDGNPIFTTGSYADMTFNAARDLTVYYEGTQRETWEWNRSSWARKTTAATVPAALNARTGHSIGSFGSSVILFGGTQFGSTLGDAWRWDGTSWTQVVVSPSRAANPWPSPVFRQDAALVRDEFGNLWRVGGSDYTSSGIHCFSDAYYWNGAGWSYWAGDYGASLWPDPEGDGSPTSGNSLADLCVTRGRTVWDAKRHSLVTFNSFWGYFWEWKWNTTGSWVKHTMGGPGPLSFEGMIYDTTLQSTVVLADGKAWAVDLAANVYHQIPTASPYGVTPTSAYVTAFDDVAGRAVVASTLPWTWESGTVSTPAHLLTIDYSRANGPDPGGCVGAAACPIQRIDVTWAAGGTSPAASGATLQAWTGDWTPVASTGSTAAAPTAMTWSWTSASPFPAGALFHGKAHELTLAVVPQGSTTGAGTAQVASDAAEVTIRYRRP